MSQKMPKHIVRLLLLLGIFLILAFAAKTYLTDPSYYKYGYYRADAVPELAEGTPQYLGSAHCTVECHQDRSSDWPIGAHKAVQCEVCHGASQECPVEEGTRIPADTIKLCSGCHESMPARPATQPQIVLVEHPFADGEIMQCIECHDPHAPGPVLREEEIVSAESPEEAAAEALAIAPPGASKCAKCHGKVGEGVKKNPPLAGVASAVFVDKMQMYRAGAGDSKIMTRFAKALSDEEIVELAEYYENLPAKSPD
jgi:cytochrome c553